MATAELPPAGDFDHLDEGSIGLTQLVFQSLPHMAPATGLALGLLVVVSFSGPTLPLFLLVALAICLCVASSLAQMAKHVPSAGGWYAYTARGLGPKAGFMVGWIYLLVIPAGMTLILLSLAFVVQDVTVNEKRGLGWEGSPWWLWVLLGAAFLFVVAYRGVRLAMNAAIVLGAVELLLFGALAVWMIVSNYDENTVRVLDPGNALGTDFELFFKGLVLAILVYAGFEGAAPLAEEARNPRKTWVELGDIYWGAGWVLILLAIVNSLLGLGNAAASAASRIVYALGRNGAIPEVFAGTHPRYRTPHFAIASIIGVGTTTALLVGWKWDLLTGLGIAGVALTVTVMLIYIAVCVSTFTFYLRERRDDFSIWLHAVVPLVGVVGLVAVLYYQYRPLPPYPVRWANWLVIGEIALGLVVMFWLARTRRSALDNAERVFVDSEPQLSETPLATASSQVR